MLLNVADPFGGSIIWDSNTYNSLPARDELNTITSKGLNFYALTYYKTAVDIDSENLLNRTIDFLPRLGNNFVQPSDAYRWDLWEEPLYQFRLKNSYPIIADYFEAIQ
jgi:hypothetical protein